MMKQPQKGLVTDLMPNIRLMQISGHFMFNYYNDGMKTIHKIYCFVHLGLILMQFSFMVINMIKDKDEVNELTANTITVLFFTHSIVKLLYFAGRSKMFYRTLANWNNPNSHPLFAESNARFHSIAVTKMRRLLFIIGTITVISVLSWTGITFVGESTKLVMSGNVSMSVECPRLMIKAWYPYNEEKKMFYMLTLVYQFYWLTVTMTDSNTLDVMFCSWLIFACEQLQHLKHILKPLMELSATLDSVVPHSSELFKAGSADHLRDGKNGDVQPIEPSTENMLNLDLKGIYNNQQDFSSFRGGNAALIENGNGNPNGLTRKQEMLVRSAIKYWVERHKHIVRLVTAIGDAYGVALLLHMLITTITLTLLAYQATKVNKVDPYAASVIGYLLYTLGQVFTLCIFGNRLIEESSSVMEAAYSCHWYDGSEEAKTFVQIVCQQCQKAMSISGAKFFTVSLDLFASVLGAVVTYFMVLVQLK